MNKESKANSATKWKQQENVFKFINQIYTQAYTHIEKLQEKGSQEAHTRQQYYQRWVFFLSTPAKTSSAHQQRQKQRDQRRDATTRKSTLQKLIWKDAICHL